MDKHVIIGLLFFLTVCFLVIYWFSKPEPLDDQVHVYFLNTKEADAIVMMEQGHVVMIDTGEAKDKAMVLSFLQRFGIQKIDLLILTHPDKDHIGNALDIIKKFTVEQVYQTYFLKGSQLESDLQQYIQENNVPCQSVTSVLSFEIGQMKIGIYPPQEEYDSSNNHSLVTTLEVGETHFFFGADIEKERIASMLALELGSYDVVKVPYHGRYQKNLFSLIEKLDPKVAVITGKKNEKVETFLKQQQIDTYYTEQREIHMVSDGKRVVVK